MRPVPDLVDDELARLVRGRLEARQPRRLPGRFTPPAGRPRRTGLVVVAAAAVALLVLALAGTAVARPDLAPAVLSGLRGLPAATPAPASTQAPLDRRGRPTRPAYAPPAAPSPSGGAPAGAPAS